MAEPAAHEGGEISSRLVSRLIEELWRPGEASPAPEVFALLDAARDPRILPLIRRSKLDYRCLFLGDVHPALARTAPYLVHLARRSRLTRELLRLGWGNAWGIFVRSPAILQDLRRHFRGLLRVRDEAGKVFFFRFYDPRVLRIYLPTCNREELRAVFGPVERYLLETDDSASLSAFSLVRAQLRRDLMRLEP